MSEGYLFCVGGNELYYKLLQRALTTLRKFDSVRPICILTEEIEKAKQYSKVDNVQYKEFRILNHFVPNINPGLPWHRYGFYPKVFQFMYTPFERTMFFDVDYVFLTDFTYFWDQFRKSESELWVAGRADENNCSAPDWHWGFIYRVIQESGICIPMSMSSFMIYKKSIGKKLVKHIREILNNLEKWECKPQYCGGYPDEIVISILMGLLEIRPNEQMFDWLIDSSKVLSCDKNV